MENISEITKLLVCNFSKSFHENEIKKKNQYKETELQYLELIFGTKPGENMDTKLQEQNRQTQEECNDINDKMILIKLPRDNNLTSINNIYFIDDIVFVYKLIEYRKLEIKKKLTILKYNLVLFNYLIINIKKLQNMQQNMQQNIENIQIDIQNLILIKEDTRNKINYWMNQNGNINILLQDLNKYHCLSKNIEFFCTQCGHRIKTLF